MDSSPDVEMTGEAEEDFFGCSVSTAGDVNGDGFSDVIVGAYGNDEAGSSSGSSEKLEVGNIDIKKEFNYAGDTVEAVWILVNQTDVYEAVIGCGEAHSLKEWVEYCFGKINKNWKEYVVSKENFVPEFDILVSNPKLIKSLRWKPKVNFHQLADIMMSASKF